MEDRALAGESGVIGRLGGAVNLAVGAWAAERDRQALWLPVSLALGIGLYFAAGFEPPIAATASAAGLAALLAARLRRTAAFAAALGLAVAVFGLFWAGFHTELARAPILERAVGPTEVRGRILRQDRVAAPFRILLEDVAVERLAPEETPARLRLSLARLPDGAGPGARIAVLARLTPLPQPALPGGYDPARRAFFQQTGATGFALGKARLLEEGERGGVERLRHRIAAGIHRAIPDPAIAGVAIALTTGLRGDLPREAHAAVRDAGLAHLLAISGAASRSRGGAGLRRHPGRARALAAHCAALPDQEMGCGRRPGRRVRLHAAGRRDRADAARLRHGGAGAARGDGGPAGDRHAAGGAGGARRAAAGALCAHHGQLPAVLRRSRGAGRGL